MLSIVSELIGTQNPSNLSLLSLLSALALLAACAMFTWCSAILVTIDLQQHRLPNRWTMLLAASGSALLTVTSALAPADASFGLEAVLSAMVCGFGYAVLMLVLHVLSGGGVGMGDVKLALGLGIYTGWLGWESTLGAVVAAFVLGGMIATILLLFGRANRHTQIAFGPAMILGAVFVLLS